MDLCKPLEIIGDDCTTDTHIYAEGLGAELLGINSAMCKVEVLDINYTCGYCCSKWSAVITSQYGPVGVSD